MKVEVFYAMLKGGRVWHRINPAPRYGSGIGESTCSGLLLLEEDIYTNRLMKGAPLCKKCFRSGKVQ